jgi:XRE family transcriptional regulator, regulator of sulfur utilization
MITRRDLLVALLSAAAALGGAATLRSQQAVLGSRAFDFAKLAETRTAVGSRRDLVRAPTATLDELEMHITSLDAYQPAHAPHQHPDEELIIVKEGTIEVLVNGETRTVGAGSVVFQAANQLHGIRNAAAERATYHVVRWISPGMRSKQPN